jgi:DNA-binding HxlR family transcriptional regulator
VRVRKAVSAAGAARSGLDKDSIRFSPVSLERLRCGRRRAGRERRIRTFEPGDLHFESDGLLSLAKCKPQRPAMSKAEPSQCPVARSLERIGERWTILILRDAMNGITRFDDFQASLGVSTNILSARLSKLVDEGLLEKKRYAEKPARFEYVLTDRARDFRPVLWALIAWGNKHFAPEGPSLVLVDAATGKWANPVLVDEVSGKRIKPGDFVAAAGPAANERMWARQKYRSRKSGSRLELLATTPTSKRDASHE